LYIVGRLLRSHLAKWFYLGAGDNEFEHSRTRTLLTAAISAGWNCLRLKCGKPFTKIVWRFSCGAIYQVAMITLWHRAWRGSLRSGGVINVLTKRPTELRTFARKNYGRGNDKSLRSLPERNMKEPKLAGLFIDLERSASKEKFF